jgi:membrane protein involved in colicin uptake
LSVTEPSAARTPHPDAKPVRAPADAGDGLSDVAGRDRTRLAFALLFSLLIHALLLSLTLGGQGLGLPGFGFPWQDRRAEVPELRVVLAPARVTAALPAVTSMTVPSQPTLIEQSVADNEPPPPFLSRAPAPRRSADAIVPKGEPMVQATPKADVATGADAATTPLRADEPADSAPTSNPEPVVTALERSDEPLPVVPFAASMPSPALAPSPGASSPETVQPPPRDAGGEPQEPAEPQARGQAVEVTKLDSSQLEAQQKAEQEAVRLESERQEVARQVVARKDAAVQDAARQEAARVEVVRQETEHREAERQAALRQEATRQEAARQEAARIEAARQEAERQEAVRQATIRQEAALQEAARREAARGEAIRQEAERQEAARQVVALQEATTLQEAARQEAARGQTARLEAERQDAARREAARRAMGRQLDEEAARRDAASTAAGLPSRLAPSSSGQRRGRLFGRADPNAELVLYAEAWARKIQLNMTFDMVRDAAKRPHTDPLVTVAIRSDGSVESVTFVLSSGVAEIDAAIRRIVQSQLPYQAFPPALSREFDVIEIRRTWHFDMAVRLY